MATFKITYSYTVTGEVRLSAKSAKEAAEKVVDAKSYMKWSDVEINRVEGARGRELFNDVEGWVVPQPD